MTEREPLDAGAADRTVDDLRQLLVRDAPLPPGLTARLHAHVRRASRAAPTGTTGQRIVLGALVFSVAAFGQDMAAVMAGSIVAALYVWLVDLGDDEEGAAMSGSSDA